MSFTQNIQIVKSFPAVQYEASEAPSAWHEDHEINGAFWRAANATYNETGSGSWNSIDHSQPSYAMVQNVDGSTSYLTQPPMTSSWPTSAWLGSGNHGIYNGVDFGMSTSTADNGPALQKAFEAAIHGGGGTILIPSGKYSFTSGISHTALSNEDVGIVIAGTGGSAELQANFNGPLITLTDFSSTGNGVRFRNLRISYLSATATGPAVSLSHCENISFDQVFFENCPGALLDDKRSSQCGLTNCTIEYNIDNNNQTMVQIYGAQDYVHACVIRQQPLSKGGPTGCTGILIGSASEPYVTNTHISDFDFGIKVAGGGPNVVRGRFSNIECDANVTAAQIFPVSNTASVDQLFFNGCIFTLTSDSTSTTAGVTIATNGGPNSNVSDIVFSSCIFHNWNGPGLELSGGQNIIVDACRIGSCALRSAIANAGGITIIGTPSNVTINGTDLSGTVPGDNGTQPYAISIQAAVQGLYVRGCNLSGNATAPLFLHSPGTAIEITDCVGYNDQNTVLNGGVAPTSPTSAPTSSTPYFGPSQVNFTGESGLVHISGRPYAMTFGSVYLVPTDFIYFDSTPGNFGWVGK